MKSELHMMEKFTFLLGEWDMEYRVPKSVFSENDSGRGSGKFYRILNDRYVCFDYSATLSKGKGAAHAIFAWDDKAGIYRFWWFEDSGNFLTASCNFIDDKTLFLNWHDTLLIQTFEKVNTNVVRLRMEYPVSPGNFALILEVMFTKKNS